MGKADFQFSDLVEIVLRGLKAEIEHREPLFVGGEWRGYRGLGKKRPSAPPPQRKPIPENIQ